MQLSPQSKFRIFLSPPKTQYPLLVHLCLWIFLFWTFSFNGTHMCRSIMFPRFVGAVADFKAPFLFVTEQYSTVGGMHFVYLLTAGGRFGGFRVGVLWTLPTCPAWPCFFLSGSPPGGSCWSLLRKHLRPVPRREARSRGTVNEVAEETVMQVLACVT